MHIHEGKIGSAQDNYCMKSEYCTLFINCIGGCFGAFLFQIRSSKGLINLSYLIRHFLILNGLSKIPASLGIWLGFTYVLGVSLQHIIRRFWYCHLVQYLQDVLSFLSFHFKRTDRLYISNRWGFFPLETVLPIFILCPFAHFFRSVKVVSLSFRFDASEVASSFLSTMCHICSGI